VRGRQSLLTVGHGPADEAELSTLLLGVGVELLVDIRRYPGSRAHPQLARDALAAWLPRHGVAYRWEERLGGRRRPGRGRTLPRHLVDVAGVPRPRRLLPQGVEVHHLMPGGGLQPHQAAAGAARREDGLLVRDGDPICTGLREWIVTPSPGPGQRLPPR